MTIKTEMLSHISDALGYVAWKLLPLQQTRRQNDKGFINDTKAIIRFDSGYLSAYS